MSEPCNVPGEPLCGEIEEAVTTESALDRRVDQAEAAIRAIRAEITYIKRHGSKEQKDELYGSNMNSRLTGAEADIQRIRKLMGDGG